MRPQVDHIAIKVDNLEQTVDTLCRIGFTLVHRECFEGIGIDLAEVELRGVRFELMRALHERSPIAPDAAGLHHVAVQVDDLAVAYEVAGRDEGLQIVRDPAPGRTGAPVFFARLARSSTLLEFVAARTPEQRGG
ncbi:MAG: VOC family protein [Myxococcota bacterium]